MLWKNQPSISIHLAKTNCSWAKTVTFSCGWLCSLLQGFGLALVDSGLCSSGVESHQQGPTKGSWIFPRVQNTHGRALAGNTDLVAADLQGKCSIPLFTSFTQHHTWVLNWAYPVWKWHLPQCWKEDRSCGFVRLNTHWRNIHQRFWGSKVSGSQWLLSNMWVMGKGISTFLLTTVWI